MEQDHQQAGVHRNLLLRSLAQKDVRLLAPLLTRAELCRDAVLQLSEEAGPLVYFPETLVASLHGHGHQAGVGLVGWEGLIGWSALLDPASRSDYLTGRVVIGGGSALVITAERLRTIALASPTLTSALLRFVQTFLVQMSRTLLSTLNDNVELRVSRWLLMFHDRVDGDEIAITHDGIARLLHVRRASVTEALHLLEGKRALRCVRGRLRVHDRALLERLAGSAYGASADAYRSAIGPFGKSRLQG